MPSESSGATAGRQRKPPASRVDAKAQDRSRRPWPAGDDRSDLHSRKKRLILETAARAFADRGYHETTIQSIAVALRVSKPTVYYYVRNKEEILFEIARAALEDLERNLSEPAADDLSPETRLHRFFGAYAKMIASDLGICMALVADRTLRPQSRRKLRACKKQIESRAVALLEECLDDSRPSTQELRLLAYALFGAFNWIPQWFAPDGDVPLDEIARYYVRALALPFVAQKA
ncbi:MAG: TetR/AcrR family transcriptional regulator [Burkholderiaceae bacterium]|nr:TetR/AcrR family transcriptional regulator [Burkholderiaceae bacterium]